MVSKSRQQRPRAVQETLTVLLEDKFVPHPFTIRSQTTAANYFRSYGVHRRRRAPDVISMFLLLKIRLSDCERTGVVDAIHWRLKKVEQWRMVMALI